MRKTTDRKKRQQIEIASQYKTLASTDLIMTKKKKNQHQGLSLLASQEAIMKEHYLDT